LLLFSGPPVGFPGWPVPEPPGLGLVSLRPRKPNALHDTLVKLMARPNGATMHDTFNAGWNYPAMAAVKIVERRGYKVTKKKVPGELTCYIARHTAIVARIEKLEALTAFSHTVEKLLLFARRVTLGSAKIRFTVIIVRCGPVVDRRPRWRVGKTRSRV
jgi:hypothetical protein